MSRPWKDAATLIVLARDAVKNSKYDYKVRNNHKLNDQDQRLKRKKNS